MKKLYLKKEDALKFKNGNLYWKIPTLTIDMFNQRTNPRIFSTSGKELFVGTNLMSNKGHSLLVFNSGVSSKELESWIYDENEKIIFLSTLIK